VTELQVAEETAPPMWSETYQARVSHLLGHRGFFAQSVHLLVGASILRSAIATRLDGFTAMRPTILRPASPARAKSTASWLAGAAGRMRTE
jgi:hypothetical protein